MNSGLAVFASRGESVEPYYEDIDLVLEHEPQLTLDDGADLVGCLHSARTDLIAGVMGHGRYALGASTASLPRPTAKSRG